MKKLLTTAAFLLAGASAAQAASFSFTGSFDADDDVQFFDFNVTSTSDVVLRTYSYAGGTNAAGEDIARGGFDPILALFDSAGDFLDDNDDGSSSLVGTDAVTGSSYDTYLSISLDPGAYTVAVSQYNNRAGATADAAFSLTGNFTADDCPGGVGEFCDVDGDVRTSAWAFDVLNVDAATAVGVTPPPTTTPPVSAVPLPASSLMLLAGLAGLGVAARRKS